MEETLAQMHLFGGGGGGGGGEGEERERERIISSACVCIVMNRFVSNVVVQQTSRSCTVCCQFEWS